MQNECVGCADEMKSIAFGDTFALHFALCIPVSNLFRFPGF